MYFPCVYKGISASATHGHQPCAHQPSAHTRLSISNHHIQMVPELKKYMSDELVRHFGDQPGREPLVGRLTTESQKLRELSAENQKLKEMLSESRTNGQSPDKPGSTSQQDRKVWVL